MFSYSDLKLVPEGHYVIVNDDQDEGDAFAEPVEPTAATGWNWNGTAYTGAKLSAGTAFFENQDEWYTVSAVYTYDGAAYEAACVVGVEGVESYTVTLTLLAGYTWADGTDGTKTFTFYNYTSVASKSRTDFDTAASTLYGESATVLEAIEALFPSGTTEYTITINDGEYTWDGTTFTEVATGDTNPTLEAGTYTVVLSLADGYDAWADCLTSIMMFFSLKTLS